MFQDLNIPETLCWDSRSTSAQNARNTVYVENRCSAIL